MPGDTSPDIALLLRFLAGDASSAEQQRVAEWLRADPAGERAALLESLRHGGRTIPPDANVAAGWARMRSSLRARAVAGEAISGHALQRLLRPDGLAMTNRVLRFAVTSGVIGVAVLIAVFLQMSPRSRAGWREYATRPAQRLDVTLQDGTRITLAPASHLRVPVDYGSGNRGVTLDGEAYFAVVHDAVHPFSVRARNAVATDIGTQFDVRAYADDRGVRVAVGEGEVRIAVGRAGRGRSSTVPLPRPYNGNDTLLARGDVAVVSESVLTIARGADVSAMIAWTHGELVFAETPVPEALRTLSRWYGVTFVAGDSAIAKQHLAARFPQESVQVLANQLAAALGARYERSGETIALHSTHR